jgi:prefoldin subunit 5
MNLEITLIQLAQLMALVIGGAFGIAKINSAAERLGEQANNLSKSIDQLRSWLDRHDKEIGEHAGRLSTLEERTKGL